LIDLAVIGVLTLVTKSFSLILGVVAAVFFVRAGFKRTPVKGSVFNRAMRLSVGCFGFFIALVTAALWATFGPDLSTANDLEDGTAPAAVISSLGAEDRFPSLIGADETPGPVDASRVEEIADEVASLSLTAALNSYSALLASEVDDDEATVRLAALQSRLIDDIAADTLRSLEGHIEDLGDSQSAERRRAAIAEAKLAEAASGGIVDTLRSFADELGFGFGWAGLYLTIFLSWWNGQTVGKRAMGIRVVRLDGEPITWWIAFERAGGYAAGLATGLLGFAQVYWDANRQAIHDRIVGTVVVIEGAEGVTDWESAL